MVSDIFRSIFFGVSIFITASIVRITCGRIESTQRIPLQPPGWVFGIVWPVLYVTTGVAWTLEGRRADVPLSTVTWLCCLWLITYSCLAWKTVSVAVLMTIAVTSAMSAWYARTPAASALILPLALWTTFAAYLNGFEVVSRRSEPHV